eukprot:TRINITY_DN9171_c0_g1_i1.p1 TRINITY_DN9171_c0_g1~~TRINITY_DN9171_c0_g1_i1.p1  ORF type:complete len:133 (+),score=17.59 TRINITY_DN9171_c0_g1_i1:141-539(+)
MGIGLWIGLLIAFVSFVVLKLKTVDMINDSGTYSRMYADVATVQDSLFVTMCSNAIRVQQCSDAELLHIFKDNVPGPLYFAIAEWMEETYKCLGFSNTILEKFCFSDKNRAVPTFTNTCDSSLPLFIESICD